MTLLLFVSIASMMSLMAREVTEDEAKTKALEFFNSQAVPAKRQARVAPAVSVSRVMPQQRHARVAAQPASQTAPAYYIYNADDGHGFVVIAGESEVTEVLAYSLEGSFHPEYWNRGAGFFLDGYDRQIALVRSGEATADVPRVSAVITPILLTTANWDQDGAFFNDKFAPKYQGESCYSGCVATAMAEVMQYHKHPQRGRGSWSYTSGTHSFALSRDFSQETFDWSLIPLHVNEGTAESDEVSRLMLDCGIAVSMDYGTTADDGSSAFSYRVEQALKDWFYYDAHFVNRSVVSTTSWNEQILADLQQNRPVFVGADSQTSGGGHAFVIDGVNASGIYHYNMGWGGFNNGYYTDGYITSDRYLLDEMVCGIKPLEESEWRESAPLSFSAVSYSGEIKAGATFDVIYSRLMCIGPNNFDGEYAVMLCNRNNEFKAWVSDSREISLDVGYYYISNRVISCTIESGTAIEEGDRLWLYARADGEEDWLPVTAGGKSSGSILLKEEKATSLSLNKTSLTLVKSRKEQLLATFLPEGAESPLQWESSNEAVVTVDDEGFVTAVATGTATVTAKTTDGTNLSATCSVTVENPSVMLTGQCGDDVTYSLSNDGHLVIEGTGEMYPYVFSFDSWEDYDGEITNVEIKEGVTSLCVYAFDDCENLTSVHLPESLTGIGAYAFSGCKKLESVSIPKNVSIIGRDAFRGCSNLKRADFAGIRNLCGISFVSNTSNPLYWAEHLYVNGAEVFDVVIPEGVTSVGQYAFIYGTQIRSVSIPEGVKSIGEGAFYACYSLQSVNIPESATYIGASAFTKCSLMSVTIPERVERIGNSAFLFEHLGSVTVNSDYVTANESYNESYNLGTIFGPQVREYILGGAVKTVGNRAFSGCTDLESVSIPDGVGSIGDEAFSGCAKLTSVNIPATVMSVGAKAFDGCVSLPVEGRCRYADTYLVEVTDKDWSKYDLKEGTRFIGDGAFSGCSNLVSFTVPNSVVCVGRSAFYECNSLETVDIRAKLTSYEDLTFFGCINLKSIAIPEGVTRIGSSVFSGCVSLESVTIPSTVASIDTEAFSYCTGLNKVVCLVKESEIDPSSYAINEPVKPLPGVDPSTLTDADDLYPFNPAHPDDPTTANVDETVDVTIDNVYPADECKAKWLDYYKKVYNNRTATSKTNTKWINLLRNPYIKRTDSEVMLKSAYESEWQEYLNSMEPYERYCVYKRYTTVPVPVTSVEAFANSPLADATLYVYADVIDAYRVTSPWSKFGQILPIDPLDVKEVKSGEALKSADENEPIYDLMGRRLKEKPATGVYIQGGKKYLAK